MSVIPLKDRRGGVRRSNVRNGRVYAIAFDLDTKAAERILGERWQVVYKRIASVLAEHGFEAMQGSLYFGRPDSNSVDCVLAVQDIDRRYAWFARIVRDLRMLRVEEQNDLLPTLNNELRFDESDTA